MSLDDRARQIFRYFKRYNYDVKETGEVIVFEGIYAADKGQAAAITFYTFVGELQRQKLGCDRGAFAKAPGTRAGGGARWCGGEPWRLAGVGTWHRARTAPHARPCLSTLPQRPLAGLQPDCSYQRCCCWCRAPTHAALRSPPVSKPAHPPPTHTHTNPAAPRYGQRGSGPVHPGAPGGQLVVRADGAVARRIRLLHAARHAARAGGRG